MLPGNHPESFNLRFFFILLRGILATLATNVTRRPVAIYGMFYVVFATVRARASGNEQRVRQTGVVPE